MGLVVQIGVSVGNSRAWWPLDIDSAGYPLLSPFRVSLGHAHAVKRSIKSTTYGQIGKDPGHMYVLKGTEGYSHETDAVLTLSRPASRQGKAAASGASTTGTRTPMSSPAPQAAANTPTKSSRREKKTVVPNFPNLENYRAKTSASTDTPPPQSPNLSTVQQGKQPVSREVHMAGTTHPRRSSTCVRAIPGLEKTPPPASIVPMADALAGPPTNSEADPERLNAAFMDMIQQHVNVVATAERLDSCILIQADSSHLAKKAIDLVMPIMQAISSGDNKAFNTLRPNITPQVFQQLQQGREALKTSYTAAKEIREVAQNEMADSPDINRIIDHDGPPHYDTPTTLETYFTSARETHDPVEWFTTIHPVVMEDGQIPESNEVKEEDSVWTLGEGS